MTGQQEGGPATPVQPKPRRRHLGLAEFVERFHNPETSLDDCHAILSLLMYRYGEELRHPGEIPEAVVFLTTIGSECEPHHPSTAGEPELRQRARIVLARHVIRQLTVHRPLRTDLMERAVVQAIEFYGAHEDHAALNARDFGRVCEFLDRITPPMSELEHYGKAMRALAMSGAWKVILERRRYATIPYLCARLAKALGRPTPTLTDRLWKPVLSDEDPDDLTDCITQAGLTADDLVAFSEEIRRVVALCGVAVGCDPDGEHGDEREAGKTLLILVSRVNHAVTDLRDR